jgi:hypothetical protein
VVLEPEEIYVKGVYSGRALSEVNSSSEIRHSGRQEATRSGVIKLIDNEENRVGDGGNPRIVLAIPGYSVDEGRSYREVVMRNALVKVDRCNPRTRERCKVRQGQAMQQGECLSKSVEPDKVAELQLELSRQYASCLLPVINTSAEEIRLPAGMRVATVEIQWKVAEPSEIVNNCGVNRVGRYPKQLDPQVREQNRRVPKLFEEKLQHLSPEDQKILKPALLKYQNLFKKTQNGIIPCTSYGHHEIKTGDAAPVKKQPYRVPYALRDEMRRQLEEMKERGVITEASSEWAAPVILIAKKSLDGTPKYRFCADFRGLNAVTQVPVYTMPLVQENLNRLNGNIFFSSRHERCLLPYSNQRRRYAQNWDCYSLRIIPVCQISLWFGGSSSDIY